jgi:hypothetical protein
VSTGCLGRHGRNLAFPKLQGAIRGPREVLDSLDARVRVVLDNAGCLAAIYRAGSSRSGAALGAKPSAASRFGEKRTLPKQEGVANDPQQTSVSALLTLCTGAGKNLGSVPDRLAAVDRRVEQAWRLPQAQYLLRSVRCRSTGEIGIALAKHIEEWPQRGVEALITVR